MSVFLASISPPLSGHLLSLPVFHLALFSYDQPMYSSPMSSENCFTPTSFHPFSLINSLNSHDYSYQVVFSQTWTFCCFSVSVIIASAFMCAGVTHELSTCRLRDIHMSISHHPFDFSLSDCPGCNPHCNQSNSSSGFCTGKIPPPIVNKKMLIRNVTC